ncbi:TPA: GH32 C-terminal domain-containing protein, partial [Enterococcus faecium]|nr:GH32 C-terminal domain-containing protein [Enterococcus faecium]
GKNDPRYGTIQMCDRLSLRVFIDKSSAEIFINDGELVFTERYYTENQPSMHLSVSEEAFVSSTIYHLKKDAISYE